MTRFQAMIAGLFGSLLAFGALAAFFLYGLNGATAAPTGSPAANSAASPSAQTQLAANPPAQTQPPAADAGKHYADLLVQKLATQLGVDSTRLNAAFTAAANDTLAQAVQDGAMPQADADKWKGGMGEGLTGLLAGGLLLGKSEPQGKDPGPDNMRTIIEALPAAVAPLFGLTVAQFNAAIADGQTLDALEQAHGVTHQQVLDAALAAARTALDAGVQKGQWTQAEADTAYAEFSRNADGYLRKFLSKAANSPLGDEQMAAVIPAVETAVAQTLGMTSETFTAALQAGQTLTTLEQAHNVTHQQVLDAALAAAQTALNAGVQQGKWTQAAATTVYTDLSTHMDAFLTKLLYRYSPDAGPKDKLPAGADDNTK